MLTTWYGIDLPKSLTPGSHVVWWKICFSDVCKSKLPQCRSFKALWDNNYLRFSFQASLPLSLANNARRKERDRVCDELVSRPLVQMPPGTCLHDWRVWTSHAAKHVSWMQGCDWWNRPPIDWRKHAGVWDEQRQNEVWSSPTELQIKRVLELLVTIDKLRELCHDIFSHFFWCTKLPLIEETSR